jgi:hypothetical protein
MGDDELRLDGSIEDLKRVKRKVEDRLLQIPGVNAVGIGPKFKGGKPTGEWAITVMLDQKKPLAEIPADEVVPEEIEGFKTDVDEGGPITVLAKPPTVIGGMEIQAEAGGGLGTLGCVLEEPSTGGGNSNFYALTNQHVLLKGSNTSIPSPMPVVGPTVCSVCSKCCNQIIGRVFAARLTLLVDAAIAFLDKGINFLAEVSKAGTITGKDTVTGGQVTDVKGNLIYSVLKYGVATELTTGKIRSLHINGPTNLPDGRLHRQMKDQIQIIPDSGSFAKHGDSGAAVLNAKNRKIVALLFAGTKEGHGFASPIDAVLDAFKPEFNLNVVTAEVHGQVHTVLAEAVDLSNEALMPPFQDSAQPVTNVEHEALLRSQEEILQTEAGKHYAQIVLQHQSEVRTLIDTNRRVAAVWHRNGGPTIVQKMIHAVQKREVPFPLSINEQLVSDCVERILSIFSKYGSLELRSSIEVVKPALKRLGGMSYGQWLNQLALSDSGQCDCTPLKQS